VFLAVAGLAAGLNGTLILEHAEHDPGELARQATLALLVPARSGDPHRQL